MDRPDNCTCPMTRPIWGHEDYCPAYDHKPLKVYAKRCANCLCSKAHLVGDDRIAERYVQNQVERDGHFICHKATMDGNKNIVCRGFYDRHKGDVTHLRVYTELGLVDFVPLPDHLPRTVTPEEYFGRFDD